MPDELSLSELSRKKLDERIDEIESAYEFMLAYAAQGHEAGVGGADHESEIRRALKAIDQSLEDLSEVITVIATDKNPDTVDTYRHFIDVLESDARKTQGAIRLVLAQVSISSQLIDNLNASMHLRAMLTDLFVFDEALKLA
jgi:rhamnogalacturonyl hydrolase YesR